MVGPRADYVCLSRKCQRKDGQAPTYELPVKSIACPACGSRKIKRLFNRINVLTGAKPDHFDGRHTSSSKAARIDALVEVPVSAALAKRSELKASGQRWQGDNGMVRTVPLRNLPAEVARLQAGQPYLDRPDAFAGHRVAVSGTMEERLAAAKGGNLPDEAGGIIGAMTEAPMPRQIIAKDTEYRVVKGKDGPEIAKT